MGPEQDSTVTPPVTDPAVTPTDETTPAPAESQVSDGDGVETTPETPAQNETDSSVPTTTSVVDETPETQQDASGDPTPSETPPESTEAETPSDVEEVNDEDRLTALEARVTALEAKVDPTPEEEAKDQLPGQHTVDGSGILLETNDDVIARFPRDDNGTVQIGSDGQVVGLTESEQPSQPAGSQE